MSRESEDRSREHPGELLSLWVDGDLEGRRAARVEAHLEECARCREAVEEIAALAERAGRLPDRGPEEDLWPAIAREIGAASPANGTAADGRAQDASARGDGEAGIFPLFRRRWRVSAAQAAAAAALVATLASGLTWSLARDGTGPAGGSEPMATTAPEGAAQGSVPSSSALPVRWAALGSTPSGVARLEDRYLEARAELDPATRRMLDRNLRLVDRAMAEAQTALAENPGNSYLHHHVSRTMRHKAELLQVAVRMAEAD